MIPAEIVNKITLRRLAEKIWKVIFIVDDVTDEKTSECRFIQAVVVK
jgi:hypothetical protein